MDCPSTDSKMELLKIYLKTLSYVTAHNTRERVLQYEKIDR